MAFSFKGMISRALATTGTFLLTLSGQTSAMPNQAQDVAAGPSPDDLSRQQRAESDPVAGPDGRRVTVDEVENDGKVRLAAHVNSGPTTHTNVPGHADFTRKMNPADLKAQPGRVQQQVVRPGGAAAAHVNSGPTTHTNVPGHADFTRQMKPGQMQTQPGQLKPQGVVRPGGAAAAHVNSGPTTHTNVPGHADFTRQMQPGQILEQPIKR